MYPWLQAPSGEEFHWESWKKQDHATPRLVGRPSTDAKNVLCLKRFATENNGQRNPPPNCSAICVHFLVREKDGYKCAICDVDLCVWCLVLRNSTRE